MTCSFHKEARCFNRAENHAKGLLGTILIKEFVLKSHPEYFGIVDPNRVEVDESGGNYGNCWFDMLERDWSANEVFFFAEAKFVSLGEEGSLTSKLNDARDSLVKRMESREVQSAISENWKLPENGYGFVTLITPDGVEVVWGIWKTNELLKR
ncbi:MAG: hypothetical protein ACP5LN_00965 [Thermoproteota archaeon]|jgi:hypothetical protein